jgi:hypothetical protein
MNLFCILVLVVIGAAAVGVVAAPVETENQRLLRLSAESEANHCDSVIEDLYKQVNKRMENMVTQTNEHILRVSYPLNISRCGKEGRDQIAKLTDRFCESSWDFLVTCSPPEWDGETPVTEMFEIIVRLRSTKEIEDRKCRCRLPPPSPKNRPAAVGSS